MTDRFQIVASTLLNSLVRSNGRISGGTSQVLAILVGDVLTFTVLVALGETKVNDIDTISRSLCATDQEVIRLDIAMDDSFLVNLLDSLDELHGDQQDCFKVELASASRKEVLKGGPKQIHDHNMEVLVGDRAVGSNVI